MFITFSVYLGRLYVCTEERPDSEASFHVFRDINPLETLVSATCFLQLLFGSFEAKMNMLYEMSMLTAFEGSLYFNSMVSMTKTFAKRFRTSIELR